MNANNVQDQLFQTNIKFGAVIFTIIFVVTARRVACNRGYMAICPSVCPSHS